MKMMVCGLLLIVSCSDVHRRSSFEEIYHSSNDTSIGNYWNDALSISSITASAELRSTIEGYRKANTNPIFTHVGVVFSESTIPIYDSPELVNVAGNLDPMTPIVIRWTVFRNSKNELFVGLTNQGGADRKNVFLRYSDLKVLENLRTNTTYLLKDNTVHRSINGIDHPFAPVLVKAANGRIYFSNDNSSADSYFWEEGANYYFDESGNFMGASIEDGYGR